MRPWYPLQMNLHGSDHSVIVLVRGYVICNYGATGEYREVEVYCEPPGELLMFNSIEAAQERAKLLEG